jgi:hypothetical protein
VESTLIPNIKTVKRPDGTEMQLVGNRTFRVRLSVVETFSGEPKAEQIVYTAQQSSACGFPFQVGREYVVFTYVNETQLLTSRCSQTALLEPGVENATVTWMRAYKTAPHGSEISGSLRLPLDSGVIAVPATIRLSGPENRTATADAEGKYVLRNLKAGEYSIAVQVPDGFASRPPSGARMNSGHMATTNLSGSYEFEHLSPGEYLVAARDPGFLTEDNAPTIYYPHSQRSEARTVVLGPAATVDRIDFVLPAYVNSIGQGERGSTGWFAGTFRFKSLRLSERDQRKRTNTHRSDRHLGNGCSSTLSWPRVRHLRCARSATPWLWLRHSDLFRG